MKGGRDPLSSSRKRDFPILRQLDQCDGVLILLLFISKLMKQLLDSVFVISEIINKVSVSIDCKQSLVFLCKLLHAKPKHASGALDKIRTRWILREKADCKQSMVSRVSVIINLGLRITVTSTLASYSGYHKNLIQ